MRRVIAVIGLLLAVSGQAHAQAPPFDWRPPNREAAAMLRAGSDDKAATIIDDALTSCPRAANPQEVALCTAIFTENRAIVLEHRGDLAGAEAGFKTCLSVRQSVLPPSDPLVGQAQFWLALFYERHGRSAEEIEALLAAESIARARGPQHRPEVIGLTARRARALTGLGRNADALPLYQDTYPSSSDQFGPRSKEALTALNNLVQRFRGTTRIMPPYRSCRSRYG
jgi:tetratricopeptide (TPR) repeat protein